MRAATTPAQAFRWHRDTMAGKKPAITHEPECGWFKRRLKKGGPFVPARIFLESPMDPETGELLGDEKMVCEVNGKRVDAVDAWTWLAGQPISRAEFMDMQSASFAAPNSETSQEPKYHF